MELDDIRFVAGTWPGGVIATDTTSGPSVQIDFFSQVGAWQIRAPRRVLEKSGAVIKDFSDGAVQVTLSSETAVTLNNLLATVSTARVA